jgi:signal transduction histidine kinase
MGLVGNPPIRRFGWQAYVGLGAALCAAYFLVPPTVAKLVMWPLIGGSSVAAIVAGTRWHRPARPLAWYLVAAGQLSFITGDWLYVVRVRVLQTGQVFPSIVDLFYLAFYPLLVTGLLLIRRRSPGQDLAGLIDAAIITIGLGLLSWVFLIGPYISMAGYSPGQRLVAIAYPLGDVLVLAVTVRLAVGTRGRPLAWWLLAGSVVPLLFGDTVFGLLQLSGTWGTWQHQQLLDLTWILFYVGFGAAALHPSMAALSEPDPRAAARLTRGRLLLLAGTSLLSPTVLAIQAAHAEPSAVTVTALSAGSAVLFVLALARMAGLAGEVALQQERKRTSQRVLRVAEEERTRLAAELHDGPVQRLSALLYKAGLARVDARAGDTGDVDGLLVELESGLVVEIDSLRRLMSQLRPPVLDQLGIARAIGSQGEAFQDASGIACTVHADPATRLSRDRETVLYRVTQEALANVAKHARAGRVGVWLQADNGLVRLRISDDGIGFDPASVAASALGLGQQGHFGLAGMRERVEMVGGRLLVDSAPGQGTTIAVEMGSELGRVEVDQLMR